MKIDYNIRDEVEVNTVEMKYCKRLQSAVKNNNYFSLNQNDWSFNYIIINYNCFII